MCAFFWHVNLSNLSSLPFYMILYELFFTTNWAIRHTFRRETRRNASKSRIGLSLFNASWCAWCAHYTITSPVRSSSLLHVTFPCTCPRRFIITCMGECSVSIPSERVWHVTVHSKTYPSVPFHRLNMARNRVPIIVVGCFPTAPYEVPGCRSRLSCGLTFSNPNFRKPLYVQRRNDAASSLGTHWPCRV